MKTWILPLALAIAPATLLAQPDTLVVPTPPAVPAVPAPPPVPPPPGATRVYTETRAIVERSNGYQRIVVVKGDTTIIVTKDDRGNASVEVETGTEGRSETDSAVVMARRAYVSMGLSHKGGHVRIGTEGDEKDPVTIETKRKVYRIYTDKREDRPDSVKAQARLKELRTERRNLFTYWAGLDMGVNTLLGPNGSTELEGDAAFMTIDNARSRFFAINFMEQKVEFGSHRAGLLTGMGLEFTNYHLRNNVLLAYNSDSIYGVTVDSPDLRKNKLRQMGLRVPLMLEFNTKKAPLPTREQLASGKSPGFDRKKNVHLAFGVVGSWYFDTMYKQKYRLEGEDRKDRFKGDYLLLPYRAAASVRVGYGGLNLFAEYGLTPLFRDGKGPELTPLNVGITLVGFN